MHIIKTTISGDIRWYWSNAVGTSFADSLISFALILLVLNVTGSLSMMAAMSITMALPNIVIGLFSSVWVDRWNPRRVVQISQLCRARAYAGCIDNESLIRYAIDYGTLLFGRFP